jgi:YbbR domain-containing protein
MNFWTRFKSDWQIRAYMLLLAILLWVVVVMTQVYETTVNVPVRAMNVGLDKILVSELPETIPARFSGQGKDLFVLNFFRPAHLELDMQVVDQDFDYPLHTGLIEIPAGLAVEILVLPGQNVIPVSVDDRLTVMLPVEPDVEVRTRAGYVSDGTVLVDPDSVSVSGPQTQVSRMNKVLTQERIYVGLADSLIEEVDLLVPERVEVRPPAVQLRIPVNRLGERTLQRLQLYTIGEPPGRQIILEPSVLDVRIKGPSQRLATLTPDSIQALIDLTRWDRTRRNYSPTIILPDGLELLDTNPAIVRVRLEVDSWE